MFTIRLHGHYRGATPLSPHPTVVLGITASGRNLRNLLMNRHQLTPVVEALKRNQQLKDLLLESPGAVAPEAAAWLGAWIEALLRRNGQLVLTPVQTIGRKPPGVGGGEEAMEQRLLIDYFDENLLPLKQAMKWSVDCWGWCVDPRRRATAAQLAGQAPAVQEGLKPSFQAFAQALERRRIPFQLTRRWEPLLTVGAGRARRRLSHKVTDATPGWGMQAVKDKPQTKALLELGGLPVAPGLLVETLEQAQAAAERLGYPVVTKPMDGDQGVGVVTGIADRQQLAYGFEQSRAHGQVILMERHITGSDYRFLLVRGRLLAALERIPGGVQGDGTSTIATLVERQNQERKDNPIVVEGGQKLTLGSIKLDEEAERMLSAAGRSPADIPAAGAFVRLRFSANFSMGGSVRECLAEVHPLNRSLLEHVAALFRLDVCGIDVIAPDLHRPLFENGGVICEVNAMPGVLPHMIAEPERALMDETAAALLTADTLPCPVIAVHGADAPERIRALEKALLPLAPSLASASREGIRHGGHRWSAEDGGTFTGHRSVLQAPCAEVLILEIRAADLARNGLACPAFDLLVLGPMGAEALPTDTEAWLLTLASQVVVTPGRPLPSAPGADEGLLTPMPEDTDPDAGILAAALALLPPSPQGRVSGPPPGAAGPAGRPGLRGPAGRAATPPPGNPPE